MNQIDEIYLGLCKQLLNAPKVAGTRELNNVKLTIDNIGQAPGDNIVSVRGISPSYLMGELLWYFTGRNDLQFISAFAKKWEQVSDDGETCNSAYGYIMKNKFPFNQISQVVNILKHDPNSRRAIINLNTPHLNRLKTKDEPCTIALQFYIRDGKLNCTGIMRSNDIWTGFPYDVAFFTELQKYIACRLNILCGSYTHFATSLHMYDRNLDAVLDMVENSMSKPISFNFDKFHEHKYYVAQLIEVASNHCSREYVKDFTLKLAKEQFDFKY